MRLNLLLRNYGSGLIRTLLLALVAFVQPLAAADATPRGSQPTVASGTLTRIADFASTNVPARNIDIWVPDGYPQAKPYAVLYMHDGQMLFDATKTWNQKEWKVDEVAGELIKDGKVRPFIVVGIASAGNRRHSEYFPQKPFFALPVAKQQELLELERGGNLLFNAKLASDAYLKFLVKELKPYVDAHYAVDPAPASTALMGSSMGALISLYALTEYPQVFGGMAALSTHWPGSFSANETLFPKVMLDYLEKELPRAGNHRLYFDHGTATLDAWYPPLQKPVDALLKSRGYDQDDSLSRQFPGAEHSEDAWSARLDVPLQFLFPPVH